MLFAGPLHAAQSGISLENDGRLLFDYNQRLLEISLELNPKRILVLGGGTMTLASSLAVALPGCSISVVEINPLMIELARRYFNYRDSIQIKLVIANALDFVKQSEERFDLVIMDLYDNFTIPVKFRSPAFAAELSRLLTTDGLVVANCISALEGPAAAPLTQLHAAFSRYIGAPRAIQADNLTRHWYSQNILVLAAHKSQVKDELIKGYIEVDLV